MKTDIEINNLTVTFGEDAIPAVDNASLVLRTGCVNGIIGESGCGKSVLGMSILGLLPANANISGDIWYKDENLLTKRPREMRKIRGCEIGLIPQNPSDSLNPVLKVALQLREAVQVNSMSRADAIRYNFLQLEKLGFTNPQEVVKKYPFQLSGGMKQRIVTAIGIACAPQWVIADEPTKGLDPMLRKKICALLDKVAHEETKSMLIITHDLLLARQLCDSIIVMYRGQIVEIGSPVDICDTPMHPYTAGLMAAIPSRGMKPLPREKSEISVGGCRFANICSKVQSKCIESVPGLTEVSFGRKVRCFYAVGS